MVAAVVALTPNAEYVGDAAQARLLHERSW